MPMKASGKSTKYSPMKAGGGHDSKMSSPKGSSNKMSPALKEGKVNSYGQ